jgi:hypothetical protein
MLSALVSFPVEQKTENTAVVKKQNAEQPELPSDDHSNAGNDFKCNHGY